MRGGLERVIFEFGEARIASCDIGEGKQARHGFGGFDIGVEQWSPCGGAELHGLFEPLDPQLPQNVTVAIVRWRSMAHKLSAFSKSLFATSL